MMTLNFYYDKILLVYKYKSTMKKDILNINKYLFKIIYFFFFVHKLIFKLKIQDTMVGDFNFFFYIL